MLHDGGDHRPSRFLGETAWEDGLRVAQRLAAPDDTTPLAVTRPDLVRRYLAALSPDSPIDLPVEAAERSGVAERGADYRVGQRLNHAVFGEGEISVVEGDPANPVIEVRFLQAGRRRLIASRALSNCWKESTHERCSDRCRGTAPLAERAADPVVLDCRARLGEPEAGARLWREDMSHQRHLDLDRDLASSPGVRGRHPLPAPAAFAATLRRLGVEPGRPVVVYDDTGGQLAAARAWWMLARWAGHPDVRVLDGGLPAWQKAGGSLEEGEKAPAAASDWAPAFDDDTWVEADEVFSSRALKLDARSRERFRGEHEPVDALAGHIPGAFCRPSADNLDESGCFKSPTALREALPEASDVISYCAPGSPPATIFWPTPCRLAAAQALCRLLERVDSRSGETHRHG